MKSPFGVIAAIVAATCVSDLLGAEAATSRARARAKSGLRVLRDTASMGLVDRLGDDADEEQQDSAASKDADTVTFGDQSKADDADEEQTDSSVTSTAAETGALGDQSNADEQTDSSGASTVAETGAVVDQSNDDDADEEQKASSAASTAALLALRQDSLEQRDVVSSERDALQAQEQALETMQAETLRLTAMQARLEKQQKRDEAVAKKVTMLTQSVNQQLRSLRAEEAQPSGAWAVVDTLATANVAASVPAVATVSSLALRLVAGSQHPDQEPEQVDLLVPINLADSSNTTDSSNATAPAATDKKENAWEKFWADYIEFQQESRLQQLLCAGVYVVFGLLFAVLYRFWWKLGFPTNPQLPFVNDGEWTYGIMEFKHCGRDWKLCLAACCCPAARWADTMANVNVTFMDFWPAAIVVLLLQGFSCLALGIFSLMLVVLQVIGRRRVRRNFGIRSENWTICLDTFLYCCCSPCVIMQEARQVEYAMPKS